MQELSSGIKTLILHMALVHFYKMFNHIGIMYIKISLRTEKFWYAIRVLQRTSWEMKPALDLLFPSNKSLDDGVFIVNK